MQKRLSLLPILDTKLTSAEKYQPRKPAQLTDYLFIILDSSKALAPHKQASNPVSAIHPQFMFRFAICCRRDLSHKAQDIKE
jgi:hypothetical protein